jgi:GDP-L-fucose synthase
MAKYLITGGAGMLGHALRKILANEDAVFLTREDGDLTNFETTNTLFKQHRPEKVIHCAAVVGGLGSNIIHSGEYFRNNILINLNVLEAARLSGVKRLISFMSTCVFPDKTEYPLKECYLHNGAPHPSNFGYAYAKRMLEVQSTAYRMEWGCDYIVAIPANMFGPHDNFSLEGGHVVPSLIHRTYLQKKHGGKLTVWGSGKPLREFVFVEDIARLAVWALENYYEKEAIIFSSGLEISIRELVELIVAKMDFRGEVVWLTDKPEGQFRKPSDVSKLKRLYPEFRFTPLDEALQKTISWLESQYPNIRK